MNGEGKGRVGKNGGGKMWLRGKVRTEEGVGRDYAIPKIPLESPGRDPC